MKTTEETTSLKKLSTGHETIPAARLCVSAGLVTFICLVLYFGIMNLADLQENTSLRVFNFVILLAGLVYAFFAYSEPNNNKIEYFTGLKIGVLTTLIAVVPFALFMAVYLSCDAGLMQSIQANVNIGGRLNPVEAAGAVCMEGISSGAMITFIAMQFFKEN